jgi:hypothetical protein
MGQGGADCFACNSCGRGKCQGQYNHECGPGWLLHEPLEQHGPSQWRPDKRGAQGWHGKHWHRDYIFGSIGLKSRLSSKYVSVLRLSPVSHRHRMFLQELRQFPLSANQISFLSFLRNSCTDLMGFSRTKIGPSRPLFGNDRKKCNSKSQDS